ncbi:hypothetical protein [[Clostridium] polysaccharolyticum]|uniref:Uncharacterized protein n=1 Tax=[Clostridium] polysaccharolyticum TaxID=29364 RepID=A0A1H9Y893_9FIRM|nr:hypothetical protein [[Clostridium] polysaccharolyticum]SES65159.1 hypothetical protein SAMN04487772_101213 [[Clostridium] polysaccharolyticum]
METLKTVIIVIIGFINAASITRMIYCIVKCTNENEANVQIKRIKHIVIFLVLANCAWIIKSVVEHYYK